ncbi:ABC transporter permease [Paenibacillus sp. strain BS8-2]
MKLMNARKNLFAPKQDAKRIRELIKPIWSHRMFYLFLLPGIAWFFIFSYIPLYGVTLAFKEYSFTKGILGSPWVGLKYFEQFFNYYQSVDLIKNTVVISLLKLCIGFPAPIILALMLNEIGKSWFKRPIQTISYIPHFISWVVVYTLLNRLLSPSGGPVNDMIESFGGTKIFFFGEIDWFYPLLLFSFVWKDVGWNSIIYLAAISGIDQQLYDAAKIDGAGRFKQMWHITLPGIRDVFILLFILGTGSLMSAGYEQLLLFNNPATASIGNVLDTYVINAGIKGGEMSYATAIGFFQSVIALIFILTANKIAKKVSSTHLF